MEMMKMIHMFLIAFFFPELILHVSVFFRIIFPWRAFSVFLEESVGAFSGIGYFTLPSFHIFLLFSLVTDCVFIHLHLFLFHFFPLT